MIAQVTNDSGWTWANNLVLPAAKGKDIVQAGYLNSVTCRTNIDPNLQTHCVAVGAYNYMTEFTYTQTSCNEIASNCIKDYLTSSDCFCAVEFLFPPPPQENCTAGLGGYYCDFLTFTNYHGATLPLIETYSDQPDPIWAPAITDSITKPYPSNNYVLNSVSCNLAGGCLSVGSYSSDVTFSVDTTTPYLTYNTFISSPSLWQFFRAFQPNVPLENNSYGAFTSVYCMEPSSGNEHLLCLASGNYHIFPGNTDSYPMLAKFDTLPIPATPTIEYPITAGMPTNSTGILTNVACSENCTTANFDTADCFCATGGNYMNIFPQELLAVKDAASANTWKYITPDLMPTNLGNQINSVSCGVDNPPSNTPYCVAVGSYAYTTPPSKGSFAMNGAIVQSGSDTHWLTRPVTCNIGGTPWSCVLSGVSCVNSFCMAAGYASPPNNDPTQQVKIDPIYVISTDAGVTWGAQSNNNIELIPTNLYATKLNTVNCQRYSLTSDICTVGGTGSYKRNILAPFLSTIIIGTDGSEGTWTTFVDGTPATNKPLAYQASPTQNAPFNGIGSLYESSSIPQSPITTPLQPYCNGQRGC
ncbi:MAG: hypothetical protein NTW94_08230 [Legionellales bacterium]|nr:hypothetical protein [Legionellales bacterium]